MASPVAIQLGEWRPDRAPHMSPDLSEAVNVLSVAGGYAPVPSHVPVVGTHLGFRAQGFFSVPSASGQPIVYSATGQRVYRIRNGSFDQAYYGGDISDAPWWFAQLAGEIIAGNRYVSPAAGRPGETFTAVSSDAPAAACGAIVDRNFLMLGEYHAGRDRRAEARAGPLVRLSGTSAPGEPVSARKPTSRTCTTKAVPWWRSPGALPGLCSRGRPSPGSPLILRPFSSSTRWSLGAAHLARRGLRRRPVCFLPRRRRLLRP
jgi:hypothetical protein